MARRSDKKLKKQQNKSRRLSPASFKIEPRNPRQEELLKALREWEQCVVLGPAGTGKTYLPTAHAVERLANQEIEKIVLIRPATEAGERHGFLPGGVNEKMAPWVAPFMDVLTERLTKAGVEKAMREGKIVVEPISYIRGRTLSNSVVLLDEAQNATLPQLKLILTRIGEHSQLVLGGDTSQTDIGPASGLRSIVSMIEDQDLDIPVIRFSEEEVVRSNICRVWTQAFRRWDQSAHRARH